MLTPFWPRFWAVLYTRLAPFLALLDARYLPLLFTVAPQAYAVYDWLGKSGAPEEIRWLGAIGYEAVYVGSIAWPTTARWKPRSRGVAGAGCLPQRLR